MPVCMIDYCIKKLNWKEIFKNTFKTIRIVESNKNSKDEQKIKPCVIDKRTSLLSTNTNQKNKTKNKPNTSDKSTGIFNSIRKQDIKDLETFIKEKGDVDKTDPAGNTLLILAVKSGNKRMVEILLDAGCSVNATNYTGKSPLIFAANKGNFDICRLLIKNGTNINQKENQGFTPLRCASSKGHFKIVKLLIEEGCDLNPIDCYGKTPIHSVVKKRYINICKLLINSDCDINVKDKFSQTPLILAVKDRNLEIIELLLAKGADVGVKDKYGRTAMDYALNSGKKEVIDLLKTGVEKVQKSDQPAISREADIIEPEAGSQKQNLQRVLPVKTCLSKPEMTLSSVKANKTNQEDLVQEVSQKTTSPKAKPKETEDQWGRTRIFHVIRNKDIDRVKKLIKSGVNINKKDHQGITPLHLAVKLRQIPIIKALLEAGCYMDPIDSSGKTPLMYAAKSGKKEICEMLLKYGADINTKDKQFATPLHIAAVYGYKAIVELFLNNGCKTDVKDIYERTPFDRAVKKGNHEIIQLLESWDKKSFEKKEMPTSVSASINEKKSQEVVRPVIKDDPESINENKNIDLSQFTNIEKYKDVTINKETSEIKGYEILNKIFPESIRQKTETDITEKVKSIDAAEKPKEKNEERKPDEKTLVKETISVLKLINKNLNNCFTINELKKAGDFRWSAHQPSFFAIDSEVINVSGWYDLYFKLVNHIHTKQEDDFGKILKIDNFSRQANGTLPKKIPNSNIYMDMFFDIEEFMGRIIEMLILFEYPANALWIKVNLPEYIALKILESSNKIYKEKKETEVHKKPEALVAEEKSVIKKIEKEEEKREVKKATSPIKRELFHETVDNRGRTGLYKAIEKGGIEEVKSIINRGGDINRKDNQYITPLHWAVKLGKTEIVKLLINSNCEKDPRDNNRRTPLHYASKDGAVEIAKILIDSGCQIGSKDIYDKNPLHIAAGTGVKDLCKLLIKSGADLNKRDKNLLSPLHIAVIYNQKEIAGLLIENGCNINLKDTYGKTPLHRAVEKGFQEIVELLLENRCDVYIRDNPGFTPLYYAVQSGKENVIQALLPGYKKIVDVIDEIAKDILNDNNFQMDVEKFKEEVVDELKLKLFSEYKFQEEFSEKLKPETDFKTIVYAYILSDSEVVSTENEKVCLSEYLKVRDVLSSEADSILLSNRLVVDFSGIKDYFSSNYNNICNEFILKHALDETPQIQKMKDGSYLNFEAFKKYISKTEETFEQWIYSKIKLTKRPILIISLERKLRYLQQYKELSTKEIRIKFIRTIVKKSIYIALNDKKIFLSRLKNRDIISLTAEYLKESVRFTKLKKILNYLCNVFPIKTDNGLWFINCLKNSSKFQVVNDETVALADFDVVIADEPKDIQKQRAAMKEQKGSEKTFAAEMSGNSKTLPTETEIKEPITPAASAKPDVIPVIIKQKEENKIPEPDSQGNTSNVYIEAMGKEYCCISHFIDCSFITLTENVLVSFNSGKIHIPSFKAKIFKIKRTSLSFGAWNALEKVGVMGRIIQIENEERPLLILEINSVTSVHSITDRILENRHIPVDTYIINEIERLKKAIIDGIFEVSRLNSRYNEFNEREDKKDFLKETILDDNIITGSISIPEYIRQKAKEYVEYEKALELKEKIKRRKDELIEENARLDKTRESKNFAPDLFAEKSSMDYFLKDLQNIPEITDRKEVFTLVKLAQAGDMEARNILVEGFLRLLLNSATFRFLWEEIPDLIQEGCIGLINAVEKFDITKASNIHSYANLWIRQTMSRYASENSLIRIPIHAVEDTQKMLKHLFELWFQLGREPSKSEISKKIFPIDRNMITKQMWETSRKRKYYGDIYQVDKFNKIVDERVEQEIFNNVPKVESLLDHLTQNYKVSLDLCLDEETGIKISDFIIDPDKNISDGAILKNRSESITDALYFLTARQKKVLELRFGLKDGKARTLQEVGEVIGVTRERIRQIEANALKKLQHPTRAKRLKVYDKNTVNVAKPAPFIDLTNDKLHRQKLGKIISGNNIQYWNYLWNNLDDIDYFDIFRAVYWQKNYDLENNRIMRDKILDYLKNRDTRGRKHSRFILYQIVEKILTKNERPMTTREIYYEIKQYGSYSFNSISATCYNHQEIFVKKGAKWGVREVDYSLKSSIEQMELLEIKLSKKTGEPLEQKTASRDEEEKAKVENRKIKIFKADKITSSKKLTTTKPKTPATKKWRSTSGLVKEINNFIDRTTKELLETRGEKIHFSDYCFILNEAIQEKCNCDGEFAQAIYDLTNKGKSIEKLVERRAVSGTGCGIKRDDYVYDPSVWALKFSFDLTEAVTEILNRKGEPMYYQDVLEILQQQNTHFKNIQKQKVYNRLTQNPDIFIRTARGVYGLKKWGLKEWSPQDALVVFLREAGKPRYKNTILRELCENGGFSEKVTESAIKNTPQVVELKHEMYGLKEWIEEENRQVETISSPDMVNEMVEEVLDRCDLGAKDQERVKILIPILLENESLSMFDIISRLIDEHRFEDIREYFLGTQGSSPEVNIKDGTDVCVLCDNRHKCFEDDVKSIFHKKDILLKTRNIYSNNLLERLRFTNNADTFRILLEKPLYLRFLVNYQLVVWLKNKLKRVAVLNSSRVLIKEKGKYCPFDDVWSLNREFRERFIAVDQYGLSNKPQQEEKTIIPMQPEDEPHFDIMDWV